MSGLPLPTRAEAAAGDTAIVAEEGRFTYGQLTAAAHRVAATLLDGRADLGEDRIACMVPPGFRYVAIQWGTWAAGGVAVPLCTTHPAPELDYVLGDADVAMVVAAAEYKNLLAPLAAARGVPLVDADEIVFGPCPESALPAVDPRRRALILYTSGSTGKPKGVVWAHAGIEAQARILSEAWGWQSDDHALLVLPLHHVHGLVNVVTCSLWNGATCEMLPKFDADRTFERLVGGDVTVFMAVPTIYRRLIPVWEAADEPTRREMTARLAQLRLMVSGSAALPVPTLDRWREVSGHTLLERYGMTEIGMALSNPYRGTRTPGAVGLPLPTVELRLVDADGRPVREGVSGEIEVRGPSVFKEYWRRPDATADAFRYGWFRTGDAAVFEEGVYRILGRQSVDIIKSGGEKVSALEIEDVLRGHPDVKDCAVVGIPDEEWGERVAVAVVASGEAAPELADIRDFARVRLAPYKIPRQLLVVDDLPRNAMGKVVKPLLKEMLVD